jgi:hypothetical protein
LDEGRTLSPQMIFICGESYEQNIFYSVLTLGSMVIASLSSPFVYANHAWGNYHWARTANPIALKLGDNLTSSEWKSLLQTISTDWSAGNTPISTTIAPRQLSKQCKMVAVTTQVCNGKYGANGWLGLASINITDGVHITQGTAKMNDTYFQTATYNNLNEKKHVICQEVAHTFGLGHQSEDGSSQNSCMDYFSNTGANATSTLSTTPNAHDFDMLNMIYAHLDSSSTVAAATAITTSPFDSVNSDTPDSWGRLVSQSSHGRNSIYERALSNGSKVLTHVYWTNEAALWCPSCDHRYDH